MGSATLATEQVEFTYDWYEEALCQLDEQGRTFRSYGEDLDPGCVLLRHDVDLSPEKARRIAEIEASLGIEATYFFGLTFPLYNPLSAPARDVITEIANMGHDIGVHFSTHQYWNTGPPDEAELTEQVHAERAILSTLDLDVISTISFHVPPTWVLGETFEGVDSTYEPKYFEEIAYRGDSNQRWRNEHPFSGGVPPKVQILTHPGLWGETDGGFVDRVHDAVASVSDSAYDYSQRTFLTTEQPPKQR